MINLNVNLTSTIQDSDQEVASVLSMGFDEILDLPITPEPLVIKKRKPRSGPKTSQYKGVSRGHKNVWVAQYKINGKTIYLGTFHSEVAAAAAYDLNLFAIMLNGTIVMNLKRLNFGDPRLDSTKEFIKNLDLNIETAANKIIIKEKEPSDLKQSTQTQKLTPNKSSPFRGVSWYDKRSYWKASVQVNNKKNFIGSYPTAEDGARAYNAKLRELAEQETDEQEKNRLLTYLYDVPNTVTKTPAGHISIPAGSRKRKADAIIENESTKLLADSFDLPSLGTDYDYENEDYDWFAAPPNTENMLLFGYNSAEDLDLDLLTYTPTLDDLTASSPSPRPVSR